MATHFYDDCPAMNDGDEMLDKEGLGLEDWVYDCPTCQYVEQVEETAWAGGFYNGLQAALSRLDELQAAINVGHSKLQAFRLLMRDWGDPEMVSDPGYLPLLIMTSEEIMVYSARIAIWEHPTPGLRMMWMCGSVVNADVKSAYRSRSGWGRP